MMDYKRLYKTWSGTIPAGGSVKISMGGFYIRFLESDATGLIAVNDGDPGVAVGGLGLSLPDGFENFRLTNPTGSDWTVTVGVSEGTIEDSRLNVPSGIDVNISSDTPGDAGRAAILAMMQNADDQRVGLTPLGASFFTGQATASPTQIINPSLNVAGAAVRSIQVNSYGGEYVEFYVGTTAPGSYADTSKRRLSNSNSSFGLGFVKDIILDVGDGLFMLSNTSGAHVSITWDYLS